LKAITLKNSKGISVFFLVIAMLLMVTIGYVFSYLIPTKQKSVRAQIYSPQAFFIAQSGVEFAIRYAADQGWRGATDGTTFDLNRLDSITRTLGNGSFTINYNNTTGDILTSRGTITGSSETRIVRVSNFEPFLVFIFDPASEVPCRSPSSRPSGLTQNRTARFYIKNITRHTVTLNRFSASWTPTGTRRLNRIYMYIGGAWVLKYNSTYNTGNPPPIANLSSSQAITSNQVIPVITYWNGNLGTGPLSNIIVTFITTNGNGYAFNSDAAGNGLPLCTS
jgi:hypothetical protein